MEPQIEALIKQHKKEKSKLEQKFVEFEAQVKSKYQNDFDDKLKIAIKELKKQFKSKVQQKESNSDIQSLGSNDR